MNPPTTSPSTVQIAAPAMSRKVSELVLGISLSALVSDLAGLIQAVAETADGVDHIDTEFLAQTSDEDFDGVRVAVEILIVEMLDQIRARHHLPLMVREKRQQPIFGRGQLDRIPADRHARTSRVDAQRSDFYVGRRDARRAAQQRAQARQQLLGVERLGNIIVGARIEARDFVTPAITSG